MKALEVNGFEVGRVYKVTRFGCRKDQNATCLSISEKLNDDFCKEAVFLIGKKKIEFSILKSLAPMIVDGEHVLTNQEVATCGYTNLIIKSYNLI